MTKSLYSDIRRNSSFLFKYYLESGGIIKNEEDFKNNLNIWLLMNHGVGIRAGSVIICKFLDKKHQFSK